MTRIFSRTLGLLALGGVLVACGETRVPPAFEDDRTAWLAGCRSGHARGEARYGKGLTRDAERYADPAYREAWDAGHEACIRDVRRIGRPGGGEDGAARRGDGLPAAKSGPGGSGTPGAKSGPFGRGGGGGGGGMGAGI